nr:MAG TPA: hypothetical protein [Caudoviricetes sp.]
MYGATKIASNNTHASCMKNGLAFAPKNGCRSFAS